MHQPAHQLGDVIVNTERIYTPDRARSTIRIIITKRPISSVRSSVAVMEQRGISRRFETRTMKKCRIRRTPKKKGEKRHGKAGGERRKAKRRRINDEERREEKEKRGLTDLTYLLPGAGK